MHQRSLPGLLGGQPTLPICRWEDLKVEGESLTALPVFDLTDDFAAAIARKVDGGFITSCSVGIQILETSSDPKLMLPGQKNPTVTKCVLREISLCDIPSNGNAVVLFDQSGQRVDMSVPAQVQLAFGQPPTETGGHSPASTTMDQNNLTALALALGLAQNATLADVQGAITGLSAENQSLKTRLQQLEAAQTARQQQERTALLADAVKDGRITQAQVPQFETLFAGNHDATASLLAGLPKTVQLSQFTQPEGGGAPGQFKYNNKTYRELHQTEPQTLANLKTTDLDTFKQLYKAEYGVDYVG
jgi:hypothetical protein